MNFNKIIKFVITEADNVIKTTANKPIVDAIKNRRKITFDYSGPRKPKKNSVKPGKRVEVEPVAMGLSKKGNLIIRAWVEPPSTTKTGFGKGHWRTFMLSRAKNVEITDKTFDSKRPDYKEGDDKLMSVTYVKSDWTKKPRIKKYEKPTDKPKPITKVEPIIKKEPEKVEPSLSPEQLPQPKPEEKPSETPTTEPQPQDIDVDGLNDKQKELYNKKREDWINQQKQIGGNIKPGQGTRERFRKEVEKELSQPKPEEKPEENPEDEENQNLSESIKRIKSLMFS